MIEAVNSVLANASLLRGTAEQLSTSATVQAAAASSSTGEELSVVPRAPYISPYIEVDNNYNKAVLQIRDSDTGDVLKQFPSKEALEARARQRAEESRAQLQKSAGSTYAREEQSQIEGQSLSRNSGAAQQSSSASSFISIQSETSSSDVSASSPSFGGIPQAQVAAAALASSAQVSQASSSGSFLTA